MKYYVWPFLWLVLLTACQPFWQEEAPANLIPVIQIDSPASNARISVGEEIEIKSTANDEAFVKRVELYVNGELVQEDLPPIETGQKTFTVLQRWLPAEAQTVELRVVAYDNEGAASHPAAILLDVLGEPAPLAVVHPTTIGIPTEVEIASSEPTAVIAEAIVPTEVIVVENEPEVVTPDAIQPENAEVVSVPTPENTAESLAESTEPVLPSAAPEPTKQDLPTAAPEPVLPTAAPEPTEPVLPTVAPEPTKQELPTAAPEPTTIPLPTAAPALMSNMPAAAAISAVEGRLMSTTPLNIYNIPDGQSEVIGALNPNDVVIGLARNAGSDWIKIVYGADNREGWVFMTEFVWQGDIQALTIQ